jgi:cytochrome c oxidase cbb3-type subunit I/II
MPSYEHLMNTKIDFKKVTDRVWAAHLLGAPYKEELTNGPALAEAQAEFIAAEIIAQGVPVERALADGSKILVKDTQVVALIAYLQRLGTDLFKSADPEPADPAPADDAAPALAEEAGSVPVLE